VAASPLPLSSMLYQPARHGRCLARDWDPHRARARIRAIVQDTEARFSPRSLWPAHPGEPNPGHERGEPIAPGGNASLYDGASGTIWALHHLADRGAVRLTRDYREELGTLLHLGRESLGERDESLLASYLMGEVPVLLMAHGLDPSPEIADRLEHLLVVSREDPARDLMWGAPGALLAALFLHEQCAEERWARSFRETARMLWALRRWSPEGHCHYWIQATPRGEATFLGALHGVAGIALAICLGRHLLDPGDWAQWQESVSRTMKAGALASEGEANWPRNLLQGPGGRALDLQVCHGAPGVIICLAQMPGPALDALLVAGGETAWMAGPLERPGSLCHGTCGNGYAFLKLYERTQDARWLARARSFAMHAIDQSEAQEERSGQLDYALWTGDLGLAVYLWDCLQATTRFPTLDVFHAQPAGSRFH